MLWIQQDIFNLKPSVWVRVNSMWKCKKVIKQNYVFSDTYCYLESSVKRCVDGRKREVIASLIYNIKSGHLNYYHKLLE